MDRAPPFRGSSPKPFLGAVLFACLALPAFAQQPALNPGDGTAANCQCRAKGQMWDLGAAVCIDTAEGPRLMVCGMVLNNTSWRPTNLACPLAQLDIKSTKAAPKSGFRQAIVATETNPASESPD